MADQYLILSRRDATALSHKEAVRRGSGGPDQVTQFWWGIIEHPTDGRVALRVGDTLRMTGAEKADIKDREAMRLDGWFDSAVAQADGSPPEDGDPLVRPSR